MVPGTVLWGRYRVLGPLGQGGMGAVYQVVDLESDARRMAVKLLAPSWMEDPEARARLHREVATCRALDHPGIVRVFDAHEDTRHVGFAMEWLSGATLQDHLDARVASSPLADAAAPSRLRNAAAFARQIALPLSYLHRRLLVHRDVKPANIMLTPGSDVGSLTSYSVKLLDFGIVHVADRTRLTEVEQPGTIRFMAPELLYGSAGPSPQSDVFSLGMILYRLMTGQLPGLRPAAPSSVNETCTPQVDRTLLACLAESPDERPASAMRVAEVLGRAAEQWAGRQRLATSAAAAVDRGVEAGVVDRAVARLAEAADHRVVRVPPAEFRMGSLEDEPGRFLNERPHAVRIARPFLLGTTPVTQRLWTWVMGPRSNPSRHPAPDCPVEQVSWFDAVEFCNRLSERLHLETVYALGREDVEWDRDAIGFRLPTEAEWEMSARAGGTAPYPGSDEADAVGWHVGNAGGSTQPVAKKSPNALGLHDMAGNVGEWVWDRLGTYPAGPADDPAGPDTGRSRLFRGGSHQTPPRYLRCACRNWNGAASRLPDLGFRIALTTEGT